MFSLIIHAFSFSKAFTLASTQLKLYNIKLNLDAYLLSKVEFLTFGSLSTSSVMPLMVHKHQVQEEALENSSPYQIALMKATQKDHATIGSSTSQL
uniref:Uncharacterized protein n=1 Tax=Lactuca sativa TaxID=4236 RepID=A0A9R1X6M4_LACSA|nr:hypothetical protein LSAT_V11C600315020 [Lactuca sativa]